MWAFCWPLNYVLLWTQYVANVLNHKYPYPNCSPFQIGPFRVSHVGKTKIKINIQLNLHGTVSIASASVSMDLYVLFMYQITSFNSDSKFYWKYWTLSVQLLDDHGNDSTANNDNDAPSENMEPSKYESPNKANGPPVSPVKYILKDSLLNCR